MESQPKERALQNNGVGCGCLLLAILLILAIAYRVFIFEGEDVPHSQAAPTSTTLEIDDNARLGCFEWWQADDPSILTTDEAEARRSEGLGRAAESSVYIVAAAARKAQVAYGTDPPFEEFSTAIHDFEAACEAVGERRHYFG
jgi:hypothetical protein